MLSLREIVIAAMAFHSHQSVGSISPPVCVSFAECFDGSLSAKYLAFIPETHQTRRAKATVKKVAQDDREGEGGGGDATHLLGNFSLFTKEGSLLCFFFSLTFMCYCQCDITRIHLSMTRCFLGHALHLIDPAHQSAP